jgi:hypothetical protein
MLSVSDFFCGCGGLSQGFREAGFSIKTGIDFNKSFLETYSQNFPEAKVLNLDLGDNKFIDKISYSDVVIGGPPCQGFSLTGPRNIDDPRNEKKISLKVITQPRDELIGLEGSEIEEYKRSLQNFTKTHNPETDEKTILQARRQLARYHRSEKRGLLNLYPILGVTNLSSYKKYKGYKDSNENIIEGHHDIKKIDPNHLTNNPLMGFQLSFPTSKMGDKAAVEYMVNSVYSDSEFA